MDEAKVKYRHELKYVSSEMELALVKGRKGKRNLQYSKSVF